MEIRPYGPGSEERNELWESFYAARRLADRNEDRIRSAWIDLEEAVMSLQASQEKLDVEIQLLKRGLQPDEEDVIGDLCKVCYRYPCFCDRE